LQAFDELQRHSSSPRDALRILQTVMQADVSAQAPAIACPTLVLHATKDAIIPFDEGRLLASLIPGARFVALESANHILLEAEPAWPRFLDELDAFLPSRRGKDFDALSARERELVELLARGLDNHQIAAHLELTEKTVRNMVSTVLGKLLVETRAQAIIKAREAGFGAAPS